MKPRILHVAVAEFLACRRDNCQLLLQSDCILLLTSRSRAFDMVKLRSMAAGVLVAVTRTGERGSEWW